MVKMPANYKDFPNDGELQEPQTKKEHAILLLRRFCFLGSFEPANVYRAGPVDVGAFNKKLSEYCQLVESDDMLELLQTTYDSKLKRRDEVNLVYAVYLLADEVHIKHRTELRNQFPTLIKTDGDLFMFCKYAAVLHHEKKRAIFCKTIKKAIISWYKQQTMENIANWFSVNRGRHGFTHRGLVRMCRINDSILGTRYLYQSLANSCTALVTDEEKLLPLSQETNDEKLELKNNSTETKTIADKIFTLSLDTSTSNVEEAAGNEDTKCDPQKVRSIILAISKLRTTTDAAEALKLVEENDIKYEQLPYHLLQFTPVLKAVAPAMSCLQLIRCFNSDKVRKHFSKKEVLKVLKEKFQKRGGLKSEKVDPIILLMNMDKLSISQPLRPTNNKKTSRGRLVQFSKQLFKNSFWDMEPTNLRIHITINMQYSYMKKKLRNTKSIGYQMAAVALAFSFFKMENNCDVFRWTEAPLKLVPVEWNKKMDFVNAFNNCTYIQNVKNKQLLYAPIMHANENEKVYDLFIVIVPSATRGNKRHVSTALAEHIEKYRIKNNTLIKFVIVDLMRFKKSMTYSETRCENILEICGLDEHTFPLILNFAQNHFN